MYDTYRIMSAKLPKDLQEKELEELCKMYDEYDSKIKDILPIIEKVNNVMKENLKQVQEDKSVRKLTMTEVCEHCGFTFEQYSKTLNLFKKYDKPRSDIFRTMYCKLFPMMLSVQKNYTTLSPVQRVEVTKMILISTLRCYSKNPKAQKTKFSTYYMTNLKNGMMTQINSMKCNKRCIWSNMIENEEQTTYALATQSSKDADLSIDTFLKNIDNSTNLSTAEKAYIRCIMDNGNLSEKLKKGETEETKTYPTSLGEYIDKLNAAAGFCSNPISKDEQKSLTKKLRKSIKEKFLQFDRDLFFA